MAGQGRHLPGGRGRAGARRGMGALGVCAAAGPPGPVPDGHRVRHRPGSPPGPGRRQIRSHDDRRRRAAQGDPRPPDRPRPSPAPTTPASATSSASWPAWPPSPCSGCWTRPACSRPGHPGPGRRRRPLGRPGRPHPAAAAHQPPPAGATTLLVSLGLLDQPGQLAWILAGVVLLTAVAWALNRLAGLPLALRQD
jgi:hypothetical protein